METFASRIWIWLSLAGAGFWLAISTLSILGGYGSFEGKMNLAAMSILFAGFIIAAGTGIQRLSDYVSDRKEAVAKRSSGP